MLFRSLDISPDATTLSANFETFLDDIQKLMHAIEGHKPNMLLCNDTMYIRMLSCVRQKGLYATTQDNYGRTFVTWGPGGPLIWDMGVKADQSTAIIGNIEATDGSDLTSGGSTSIYAVRLGEEKFLSGFQEYAMDVNDVGLLESGIAYRTVVDWPIGIYHWHPRAMARLVGIVAA